MKLFGIEIENKTDILAAAAFLMSIVSILGQIALFLRGPDIQLFAPEQILITKQRAPSGKPYTRIAAIMVYRNSGSPGYHDTLKKEYVSFTLGGETYKLVWDEFIDSSVNPKDPTELVRKRIGEALPKHVNAGMVESHETYFAPWVLRGEKGIRSFLEWNDFKQRVAAQDRLDFTFTFETFSGKIDSIRCYVKVADFLEHLEKGWSAPVTYR